MRPSFYSSDVIEGLSIPRSVPGTGVKANQSQYRFFFLELRTFLPSPQNNGSHSLPSVQIILFVCC